MDEYVGGLLAPHDEALAAALAASDDAGLPAIQVSPPGQAALSARPPLGARTILEFGTLGGYSTIWLGRALPEGGRLVTLEADPARRGRAAPISSAPDSPSVVDLRVGPALETLPALRPRTRAPSTWSSSTPTRPTPPTTSSGRWTAPGPVA